MKSPVRTLQGQLAGIVIAVSLLLAGQARAVPQVVQVIDGLPQVVAPQQLIVRCNLGVAGGLCSKTLQSVGAVTAAVGLDGYQLVVLPLGVSLQGVLDLLRVAGVIASAEPNRVFLGSTTYPQTWQFPAAGAPGDATLLAASASAPIVAILDSGIAYESYRGLRGSYAQAPAFSAQRFVPGWDFVNNGAHANDDHGHGTAMASIIAGRGTFSSAAIPFVGSAAGVTLMPVKVLDASNQGTEFWLAEGIRYAVHAGADVINLSLDFARNYVAGASLRHAIALARANGVLIVAASGNTGGGRVLYPAAFPDVLSVGAVRLDAASGYAVAEYSNWGEGLDLVAPGGSTGDVNKDGLWDGDLAQAFPPGSPTQIGWWLFAGTSPATAHVTGAAAALLGADVDVNAVRPLLQATAAPIGSPGWRPASGSGRLQAAAAVAAARSFVAPAPLYADAVAALRNDGRAAGAVMIANASGAPVANAEVHIRWRGAASAAQTALTDRAGIARFVSPAPTSSRKLFLLEVPRVIAGGAAQRPRAFARGAGGFNTLTLSISLNLGGLLAATTSSLDGLGLWGTGGSGLISGTTGSDQGGNSAGSGLISGTTGSDGNSSSAGSGLISGTTGSNGPPPSSNAPPPSYPLTAGIAACPLGLQLFSYNLFSSTASQAFFSGAPLAGGYSVRAIDSSWVLAPGAAALDAQELGAICGISLTFSKALATNYFSSGTLYVAGAGPQPAGFGAGDLGRFWSEVMNAEGSTAP